MADRHTNEETAVSAQRSQRLLDSLFTTQRMREIFSDHGRLQAMLDFEAPLAGRTWLQQGPPVTLGLKAVGFLSAVERHRVRLGELKGRALVLQLGGAVGTLAAFDARGMDVASAVAQALGLALPDVPWHAQRDRVAEVATTLGLLVGTLGKLARDVSLLMQTEVGEAAEPSATGRGGSSTMPHKRNPVGSAVILAAAIRVPALVSVMLSAMVQEHERGLGGWHAEWETLPEICVLAAGALAQAIIIVEGLQVDAARMASNLELTRGLTLAEAVATARGEKLGKSEAHALIEEASARALAEGKSLRESLDVDPRVTEHLSGPELERLLDPRHYLGEAERLVARALPARRG